MTRTRLSGRLVLAVTAGAVLLGAIGTIYFTKPARYERFRYPFTTGRSSSVTPGTTASSLPSSPR